jgi:hypothetical protein
LSSSAHRVDRLALTKSTKVATGVNVVALIAAQPEASSSIESARLRQIVLKGWYLKGL